MIIFHYSMQFFFIFHSFPTLTFSDFLNSRYYIRKIYVPGHVDTISEEMLTKQEGIFVVCYSEGADSKESVYTWTAPWLRFILIVLLNR